MRLTRFILPLLLLAGSLRAQTTVNITLPVTLSATPTLTAGTGFTGATGSIAAVGNSGAAGYSENAICRWDTVPYQAVSGKFTVGMVAFHIEGIRGVAFSLDGGPWFHATQMAGNPLTGVSDYCATIDTSALADAQHEVRAIVYPVSGVPRTMEGTDYTSVAQSLFFYSNTHGTYNPIVIYLNKDTGSDSNNGLTAGAPVQTPAHALDLASNGGTVRITRPPGAGPVTYTLTTVSSGPRFAAAYNYPNWTTLEADSSLDKSQVILTGDGRQFINHLRLHNLTIDAHSVYIYTEQTWQAWADHVAFFNSNGGTEVMNDGPIRYYQSGGTYQTDCTYTDMYRGPLQASIVRNATCTRISEDIINNTYLVANLTGVNPRELVVGSHDDGAQYFGTPQNNIILYGVNITGASGMQGIFFDNSNSTFQDVAIVHYRFQTIDGAGPPYAQFCSPEKNFYIFDLYVPTQTLLLRTDMVPDGLGNGIPFSATNWKMVNCTVSNATYNSTNFKTPPAGVTITGLVNSGQ